MLNKVIKVVAFVGELCLLLMLYSAALLAPVPFGFLRISIALLLTVGSYLCAYFASSNANGRLVERVKIKQLISKPPMIVWIVVISIISLQLANGLLITYSANKR